MYHKNLLFKSMSSRAGERAWPLRASVALTEDIHHIASHPFATPVLMDPVSSSHLPGHCMDVAPMQRIHPYTPKISSSFLDANLSCISECLLEQLNCKLSVCVPVCEHVCRQRKADRRESV